MKFALALVALLAVGTQGFRIAHNEGTQLTGNLIDKLLEKGLEYARKLLKETEPMPIPDLPAQTIIDDDVNMVVQLTDVQLSKASNFKANNISTDLNNLKADFEVAFPTLHLEGKHTSSGTAFNADFNSNGTFSVDLTNFVQDGQIQFTVDGHSLQIKSLDLQYDLEAVQFAVTGVEASTMSNDDIVKFLNTQLLSTLKANQSFVCEKVANHAIHFVNKLMEGKSLFEMIKWLKDAINN